MLFLLLPYLLFVPLYVNAYTNLFSDGLLQNLLGTDFGIVGANRTFDYVVIGGGTGGLTMAVRLAQSNFSVAVVEAGGFYEIDNGNLSVVPAYCTNFAGSDLDNYTPTVDWGFHTTPQLKIGNRTLHYARGKTLGGSSARNYMVYQRGTAQSYQKWADQVGDQSYTFDNLLPFFKRSPNYTSPNLALYTNSSVIQNNTVFSPAGGPLRVSFGNAVDSFGTWAQKAFIALGLTSIDGFNSGRLLGSARLSLTIDPRNAHRSSSESSFLQAAIQNSTGVPTVYKNTLVQRILFDSNKTATGVQVQAAGFFGTPGISYSLQANKEVILSAGAFQSPQLLMVSGIGPKATLDKHNITGVSYLPGVGQNLWDHPIFSTDRRVNVLTASAGINNATLAALEVQEYITNATGPLSIFTAGVFGWEKLPEPYRSSLPPSALAALSTFPADWPEIEFLPQSVYAGYQRDAQTADPRDGHNYASMAAALVAPLSRGSITLQSASMSEPPLIDPAWLTSPTDTALAIQAFKRTRQLWDHLASLGIADTVEALPGLNVTSDADILAYTHAGLSTVYHASCTCKMGMANDSMAVVDSEARVYGVHGLRVVDASAFALLPPGHPQSTVYALAEKIADAILRAERAEQEGNVFAGGRAWPV